MRIFIGLLAAIVTAAIVAGGFWVYGFNFDQRGETACVVYCASVFAAAIGFCFAQLALIGTK